MRQLRIMGGCPRCGGKLLNDSGEAYCILCGHREPLKHHNNDRYRMSTNGLSPGFPEKMVPDARRRLVK